MADLGLLGFGYVAKHKHLPAIRAAGGRVVAICDPYEQDLGVIDAYAPRCEVHRDPLAFLDACEALGAVAVAVCSPNDLHVVHALACVRRGFDTILEKPIALSTAQAERLVEPACNGKQLYPVVQLRYLPTLQQLQSAPRRWRIEYHTYRGPWYDETWKGDEDRSGGIVLNLGVHLLDLCCHVLGRFVSVEWARLRTRHARASLRFARGTAHFDLRTDVHTTRRVIYAGDQEIDLTMTQSLHEQVYLRYLKGEPPWTIADAARAIAVAEEIKKCST